jgi:hypothetical protein
MCKILANMTQVSDVAPGPLDFPPFQPRLNFYINRSAVVHIRYVDSLQGMWTHIPCQSVYSPTPTHLVARDNINFDREYESIYPFKNPYN